MAGAATLAAAAPPDRPAPLTLYTDATIIDGTGAPARAHQDMLVRGQRIVAIGPRGSLGGTAGAVTVSLAGRFVIPGLIDSHVHLATPPDRARAEAVLRRDLYGGVTTVRDMADDLRPVAELARAALAGDIAAPDIVYAAVMAGPPFFKDPRIGAISLGVTPGSAPWAQAIDDATDLHTAITLARGTSAAAIKIYADLPPHLVATITAEAHRQHMLVWAHSAVFPTRPADVIAAGVDTVSHVCYLAYQVEPVMLAAYEDHTPVHEARLAPSGDDPVTAGLYRAMIAHGTILDATGSLFVRADAGRRAHPERRPLRCTGAAVIRLTQQAWRAGVPIATGTDSVAARDHAWPEVDDELEFLARDVGLPPLQVIHSATLVGATAAGQARDTGSLEPGKLANFAVLTADPTADIGAIRTVDLTVKRGRPYWRRDYRPITREEMKADDDN
ncbi:amidohydrolase family protein [Sphingomonas nostoxanthinifaciens]|uniref:amidohydrolase family protein n=1 Tax=Sphingomonas nostoxanthinifaciens TaxID=2872652 RepID=UPI001CC1CF7A|nr:amidohydrolase family protein [Sphingomonas nostoxanthinifaciens]UAK26556.1 amidohydrolase family protein [Sphingomonas nostoxanthinifaciens]